LEDEIGEGGEQEDDAVKGGGKGGELILSHPGGREREKGEPEEEVEVGPEDGGGYAVGGVEEVVVVIPVDADVDEAEEVAEEDGKQAGEGGEVGSAGDLEFEHHDGDDDGEDTVTEGFEAVFRHGFV